MNQAEAFKLSTGNFEAMPEPDLSIGIAPEQKGRIAEVLSLKPGILEYVGL